MVGKLSLKRLFYAFFLFFVLLCLHFFISVKFPPEIERKSIGTSKKENPVTDKITTTKLTESSDVNQLPWFFKKGTKRPMPGNKNERFRIWPKEFEDNDRIIEQLMYIPKDYDELQTPMKNILLWHGLGRWVNAGQTSFLDAQCPVNKCTVTDDHSQAVVADAILFKDHFGLIHHKRPSQQVWIIYLLESPNHTERFQYNDLINWTATYRRDSDIVAPYERWVYYDDKVKQLPLSRNFATNKTHQIAWFVSNCVARNGRLNYAHELQKYISIDIYGSCGPLKCPRTEECFHLLDTKYKFYLAFENSNCVDYITEKFFVNGLQHDVVPIVMGARPEDYAAVAPYHSYIHVDDFGSPEELAHYLLKLDNDDDMYNSYFRWKGTGEFINTYFFCRLCAMLHDSVPSKSYNDINKWWKNANICVTSGPWDKNIQVN